MMYAIFSSTEAYAMDPLWHVRYQRITSNDTALALLTRLTTPYVFEDSPGFLNPHHCMTSLATGRIAEVQHI